MTVVLCRIDDRLLHGQVVIGWGQPLGVEFIVVVNDQVRQSTWEQELYRMGVPPHIEVRFASIEEARAGWPGWSADRRRGFVVTSDISTMVSLRAQGADLRRVVVGGIHHRPGRTERLPYVYLTDAELTELQALAETEVDVVAQDLPTSAPVPLQRLG
jgi:PTS system mannose-specific IIB component/fructoselysine and glucoselysine-specific PTS system IIB component